MASPTGRNKLGSTKRETAESKADTTKRISQEIQRTETENRQAKTEKLRLARLAMQALLPLGAAGSKAGKPKKRGKAET
ncbi:hypothetical protein [Roseibium sp. M-1]